MAFTDIKFSLFERLEHSPNCPNLSLCEFSSFSFSECISPKNSFFHSVKIFFLASISNLGTYGNQSVSIQHNNANPNSGFYFFMIWIRENNFHSRVKFCKIFSETLFILRNKYSFLKLIAPLYFPSMTLHNIAQLISLLKKFN